MSEEKTRVTQDYSGIGCVVLIMIPLLGIAFGLAYRGFMWAAKLN